MTNIRRLRPVRRAGPPVPDAPGYDLKPDPARAFTLAELALILQEFRLWAGEPSYREMAASCGQMVSHSAMYGALTGRVPLRQVTVRAVIRGCGGTGEDEDRFVYAWTRLRLAERNPDA